jgi:hypothetical protein
MIEYSYVAAGIAIFVFVGFIVMRLRKVSRERDERDSDGISSGPVSGGGKDSPPKRPH